MLPALPSQNPAAHHHHHPHHHHSHHHHSSSEAASAQSTSTPKRNSSMIFRIEHLLPTTAPPAAPRTPPAPTPTPPPPSATSTNGSSRRSKVNSAASRFPGVYLKQFAPKDTVSDTIGTLALMSAAQDNARATTCNSAATRTYCSIMQNVLRLTPFVMRRVKLSEDIHSFNALFETHNGDVRLRIVRDIARDEELIAWFDEELTMLMAIPFLTPLNIQGNNRYTCHICQLTFETPNPLKIHLALSCGRHSLDILWIRLHYALKSATAFQEQQQLQQQQHHQLTTQQLTMPMLHHHLPAISPALRSTPQLTCTTTTTTSLTANSPLSSPQQHQQQQRFSAFKPITSSSSSSTATTKANNSPTTSPPISTATTSSSLHILPTSLITSTAASSSSSSLSPSMSTSTLSLPHHHHAHAQFAFLPSTPMSLLQATHSGPLNAAAQIEAIVSNMGASKQGHLCIYCGKVYSRKYGLKIHIRTHTGFKPLKCKFCLRPFGDPSNLNKHVRLHLQSSASATASAASSSSSLAAGGSAGGLGIGVNVSHATGAAVGESAEGYKCHLCHKTLARRRDLQRHIESRHSGHHNNNRS